MTKQEKVATFMEGLEFKQEIGGINGTVLYKNGLLVFDSRSADFFYDVVERAKLDLCQRLIDKNYNGTEINWSALGADVVNTKLKLLRHLQEGKTNG